jgi:hypothetical protein
LVVFSFVFVFSVCSLISAELCSFSVVVGVDTIVLPPQAEGYTIHFSVYATKVEAEQV